MIYTSFRIFQFLSAKYEEWAKIIKHQHQFTCLKHMALSSSTNGGSRLRSLASSCRVLSLLTRALQMNSARLEYKHPIWSMKYDEIRMILILFKFNHSCFAKPQPERLNITVTAPWDKPVQKASAQSTPPDAAGYRHIPGRNNEMNLPCHPLSHGLVQGDIWGREQTKLGTWKIEIPQMKGWFTLILPFTAKDSL